MILVSVTYVIRQTTNMSIGRYSITDPNILKCSAKVGESLLDVGIGSMSQHWWHLVVLICTSIYFIYTYPLVGHDWVITGLGMPSRVCVTG